MKNAAAQTINPGAEDPSLEVLSELRRAAVNGQELLVNAPADITSLNTATKALADEVAKARRVLEQTHRLANGREILQHEYDALVAFSKATNYPLTHLISHLEIWGNRVGGIHIYGHLAPDSCRIKSFAELRPLTALKTLHCNDIKVTDTATLSELQSLDYLELHKAGIQKLHFPRPLVNLKVLDLSANPVANDLACLEDFPELREVNLAYTSITSPKQIPELPQVGRLDLSGNALGDFKGLKGLPSLRDLMAQKSNLKSAAGLKEAAPNLLRLDLSGNYFRAKACLTLSGLTKLEELVLSYNWIGKWPAPDGLPALTGLHLNGNMLWEVSGVAKHPGLTTLSLYHLSIFRSPWLFGAKGVLDLPKLTELSISKWTFSGAVAKALEKRGVTIKRV